jgi:hypothetical protein
MTAFVQSMRSGLIWVALLVVLPGVLYAMAELQDDHGGNGARAADHPPTCGVCLDRRGTHLPSEIDGKNVYVLSFGKMREHSIN